MEDRGFNLFGFNAPSWSLFWEYIANIFYALVLYRIGRRSLVVLTILAAATLGFVSYRAGNLLGGWGRASFWISYPLYMTHYAAIWIFGNYYNTHKPGTGELILIIITGTILLIGIAWVVMTLYDIPIRRYLNNKRQEAGTGKEL